MIELMNEDAIFGVDYASGPDKTVVTFYPLDANAPVTVTRDAFGQRREVVAVYPDGWQIVRYYGTHGYFEKKERVPAPRAPDEPMSEVEKYIREHIIRPAIQPIVEAAKDGLLIGLGGCASINITGTSMFGGGLSVFGTLPPISEAERECKPLGPPPLPALRGLTLCSTDGEKLGRLAWTPGVQS